MFESNFPVDGVSCSYAALWNAFKRITQGVSADEKALLYQNAARAFYRLDP
jgi:predicted TIM-barrel fold metal-dependent hydrolase